jgi:hypothetical protein
MPPAVRVQRWPLIFSANHEQRALFCNADLTTPQTNSFSGVRAAPPTTEPYGLSQEQPPGVFPLLALVPGPFDEYYCDGSGAFLNSQIHASGPEPCQVGMRVGERLLGLPDIDSPSATRHKRIYNTLRFKPQSRRLVLRPFPVNMISSCTIPRLQRSYRLKTCLFISCHGDSCKTYPVRLPYCLLDSVRT